MRSCKEEAIELLRSDAKKDLHIHSYYSDGDMEPTKIIDQWMSNGYETIAITDHDVIQGSKIACEYAESLGINVISGIEFDSECELGTKLHILGYGIDLDSAELKVKLDTIQGWRTERNQALKREIAKRGYEISEEEIASINGGRFVGRPTFARVLVNRGDFPSVDKAFSELIQKIDDEDAVRKRTLETKEVVDTIHAAGGIAVLAHPIEQKRNGESWEEFKPRLVNILDTFRSYGIDGLECYHPSASPEQSEFLTKYAGKHGLLISRGSDFHSASIDRDYSKYHK